MSKRVAAQLDFAVRGQVYLREVLRSQCSLEAVELVFKDQYVCRSDMWRLQKALRGKAVYVGESLEVLSVRAQVTGATRLCGSGAAGNCRSMSGLITADTKFVFRSRSARFVLLVQASREMMQFAPDGFLFVEKAMTFLKSLFHRWDVQGVNHSVSILFFSRLFLGDNDESGDGNGDDSILCDSWNRRFRDYYYTVARDARRPSSGSWIDVMPDVKRSWADFEQVALDACASGRNSLAQDGNLLEATNLALDIFQQDYLDKDLNRTGQEIVVVSPGSGMFNVTDELIRVTKQRMVASGIGCDMVCLSSPPLHAVPLFRYCSLVDVDAVVAAAAAAAGAAASSSSSSLSSNVYSSMPQPIVEEVFRTPHWIFLSFFAEQPHGYGRNSADQQRRSDAALSSPLHCCGAGVVDDWCRRHNRISAAAARARNGKRGRAPVPQPLRHSTLMARLFDDASSQLASSCALMGAPPPLIVPHDVSSSSATSTLALADAARGAIDRSAPLLQRTHPSDMAAYDEWIFDPRAPLQAPNFGARHQQHLYKTHHRPNKRSPSSQSRHDRRAVGSDGGGTSNVANSWSLEMSVRGYDGSPALSPPVTDHARGRQMLMVDYSGSGKGALSTDSLSIVAADDNEDDDGQRVFGRSEAIAIGDDQRASAGQKKKKSKMTMMTKNGGGDSAAVSSPPSSRRGSWIQRMRIERISSAATASGSQPSAGGNASLVDAASSYYVNSVALPASGSLVAAAASSSDAVTLALPHIGDGASSRIVVRGGVNPFVSADDNSAHGRVSTNRRRWSHIFPTGNDPHRRSTEQMFIQRPNWTSLVEPAALPLTTDYFPTPAELLSDFHAYVHTIVLLRDDAVHQNTEDLLDELVVQRLEQGYQRVVLSADASDVSTASAAGGGGGADKQPLPLKDDESGASQQAESGGAAEMNSSDKRSARQAAAKLRRQQRLLRQREQQQQQQQQQMLEHPSKPSDSLTHFLSLAHNYHVLIYNKEDRNIVVKRYRRKKESTSSLSATANSSLLSYRYLVWSRWTNRWQPRGGRVAWSSAASSHLWINWSHVDSLTCGFLAQQIIGDVKFWRVRLNVVPSLPLKSVAHVQSAVASFSRFMSELSSGISVEAPSVRVSMPPEFADALVEGDEEILLRTNRPRRALGGTEQLKASPHNLTDIVRLMRDPQTGVEIKTRRYHWRQFRDCFLGSEAVSWLVANIDLSLMIDEVRELDASSMAASSSSSSSSDMSLASSSTGALPSTSSPLALADAGGGSDAAGDDRTSALRLSSADAIDAASAAGVGAAPADGDAAALDDAERLKRRAAVLIGNRLLEAGIVEHVAKKRSFKDVKYFYRFKEDAAHDDGAADAAADVGGGGDRPQRIGAHTVKLDLGRGSSNRYQWVMMQYDSVYSPTWCYQIELQWLISTGCEVNNYLTRIFRRARLHGITLAQVPIHKTYAGDPFRAPAVWEFAEHPALTRDDVHQFLLGELGFHVDHRPPSDGGLSGGGADQQFAALDASAAAISYPAAAVDLDASVLNTVRYVHPQAIAFVQLSSLSLQCTLNCTTLAKASLDKAKAIVRRLSDLFAKSNDMK
jgi:Vacuolar membrane-associated protein Iml1, N-terminal domain/Domain found in Dishevelled, Egl-10, and Pleckstrin (DEP)